jgi:hypothetical protein
MYTGFIEKIFEYAVSGRIEAGEKLYRDFIEIPFVVKNGTNILLIEFTYEGEGCRLMIGLIDSTNSLRGWCSRGDKKYTVFISRNSASLGYIPGDIVEGMWRVFVRLDNVPKYGCIYTLKVVGYNTKLSNMDFDNLGKVVSNLAKILDLQKFLKEYPEFFLVHVFPYPCREHLESREKNTQERSSSRWYRGDLHIHTVHSDGRFTVCEVIDLARSKGLDFIALTDHNTVAQNIEFTKIGRSRDILVIPGMEITTFYGHVNVFGINRYIDFRRRSKEDFEKLIEEIKNERGLASINHPVVSREPICRDCDFKYRDIENFDTVEVWNGLWHLFNNEALSWWHNLLAKGYRVTAIGGSDYHGVYVVADIGEPTTWVYAENLTVEDILKNIKKGRVYITYKPDTPIIDVKIFDKKGNVYTIGDDVENTDKHVDLIIQVEKAKGAILRIVTDKAIHRIANITENNFIYRERIDIEDTKFIRIEIGNYSNPYELIPQNSDDILAITNPIYIKTP